MVSYYICTRVLRWREEASYSWWRSSSRASSRLSLKDRCWKNVMLQCQKLLIIGWMYCRARYEQLRWLEGKIQTRKGKFILMRQVTRLHWGKVYKQNKKNQLSSVLFRRLICQTQNFLIWLLKIEVCLENWKIMENKSRLLSVLQDD